MKLAQFELKCFCQSSTVRRIEFEKSRIDVLFESIMVLSNDRLDCGIYKSIGLWDRFDYELLDKTERIMVISEHEIP